jgi:DNA recombination protein RmuC
MFLPLEGLYAEVVREGMVEELQKEKINIAGPTTMAALLNSLQMGFKTLAIQKSSGQVWKVLEEVKTEFGKFGDVLAKTQDRMRQASEELDKLVGTRTNMINRKLRDVSEFSAIDRTEKNILEN